MTRRWLGVAGLGALAVMFLPNLIHQSPPPPPGIRADTMWVHKDERRLYLVERGRQVKVYQVALGKNRGPKTREGDRKTPEGVYPGCYLKESSKFYRAIYLTYPTPEERRRGYTGSSVEIHGLPTLPLRLEQYLGRWIVWLGYTDGCVMLTNDDMDELIGALKFPVTVTILP